MHPTRVAWGYSAVSSLIPLLHHFSVSLIEQYLLQLTIKPVISLPKRGLQILLWLMKSRPSESLGRTVQASLCHSVHCPYPWKRVCWWWVQVRHTGYNKDFVNRRWRVQIHPTHLSWVSWSRRRAPSAVAERLSRVYACRPAHTVHKDNGTVWRGWMLNWWLSSSNCKAVLSNTLFDCVINNGL